MQQLLTTEQMRAADQHTIRREQITENDLIDRAAGAFVSLFAVEYPDRNLAIDIYCGPGNNGADGLVIAGLLQQMDYQRLIIHLCDFDGKAQPAFLVKLEWVRKKKLTIRSLGVVSDFEAFPNGIIIEALFGSGLNKPLAREWAELIALINQSGAHIVSVDIPAGLPSEGVINPDWPVVEAELVISFQRPKINFFFPESATAINRFIIADIGLDEGFIQQQDGVFHLVTENDIKQIIKPRKRFSHKGTYGHALVIAGHEDTMGAALLASSACLYAGAGLTTAAIPSSGLTALNTALPEVMYVPSLRLTDKASLQSYSAIGAGPGLGKSTETLNKVSLILDAGKPLLLDADALNCLAQEKTLLEQIPAGTILTPHMKEFDNLFGKHESWWERIETARDWTRRKQFVIVLKNQYTFTINEQGKVFINPTGNPAMAQGGMGDVLSGIILALLAQGYHPAQAAITGCYIHGKSADKLARCQATIRASELAAGIPQILYELTK